MAILVIKNGNEQIACAHILDKLKTCVIYPRNLCIKHFIPKPCENAKCDFSLYMYGDFSHKACQQTSIIHVLIF